MSDWKARALAAEAKVRELSQRTSELEVELAKVKLRHTGRTPKAPPTEKTRLVEAARQRLLLTKGEIAQRLGVDQALLSPSRKFSAADEERLMAELRRMAGE